MPNNFDISILMSINKFSELSLLFDHFVVLIQNNYLFKGGVLIPLIYYIWFKATQTDNNRQRLIATLLITLPADLLARILGKTLPFRIRPIHDAAIHFLPPDSMYLKTLEGNSSFPSDHAVLFFCLSAGLFFCSKRIGLFAFIYTLIFIAFPRLYLGLHYPTDIIAGFVIGVLFAFIANHFLVNSKLVAAINQWCYSKPEFFYPLFFIFTCEIFEMFGSSRALVTTLISYIH